MAGIFPAGKMKCARLVALLHHSKATFPSYSYRFPCANLIVPKNLRLSKIAFTHALSSPNSANVSRTSVDTYLYNSTYTCHHLDPMTTVCTDTANVLYIIGSGYVIAWNIEISDVVALWGCPERELFLYCRPGKYLNMFKSAHTQYLILTNTSVCEV